MSEAQKETLGFQTEIKQLLDLMIHSLYSNRDIFLRELISNASDACDKLRFEALDNDTLYAGDSDLGIWIEADRKARTLSIRDNGVGMNRDEAIRNLGTIARSGTKEFFSKLTGDRARDANLIGQFGVGFYSSFIVAKQVTVESRRAGDAEDQGIRWVSSGDGEFTSRTSPARSAAPPSRCCCATTTTRAKTATSTTRCSNRTSCASWCATTPTTSRCPCG